MFLYFIQIKSLYCFRYFLYFCLNSNHNNIGDNVKKVLITGARSGIINKVCDELLNKNYFLYITVHTNSELKIMQKKYKAYPNVKCFKLDITDPKDREYLKKLDIDILVSNAAMGESGSVAEIDIDKIRNNFETNVFANFEVVQIVLKNMLRKGQGRLIMMASLAGIIPIPFLGSYCATKASIIKLTEALKLELKRLPSDIDVCLIEPGLYSTGFNKLMFDKKYDWMSLDSYFKSQIELIKTSENIFLTLFEKRQLTSIVQKITKAITTSHPHFIYRAPFSQTLVAKFYNILR